MTTTLIRSPGRFIIVNLSCLTRFSFTITCILSVLLVFLLAATLLPPLIIIFGYMARERFRIAGESIWPHDSDRAWIAMGFPAVVAVLNAYGIFYGLVGLTNSLRTSSILTSAILLPLLWLLFGTKKTSTGIPRAFGLGY